MKKLFFILNLALLPLLVQAAPVKINGIYYNLNGTEAEVTNKAGGDGDEDAISNSYTGAVSIPPTVKTSGITYKVTAIGRKAFYKCSNLISVAIGDNVTTIGDYAFCLCSGLTALTIPSSVTTIGEEAFYSCRGLTALTIPSSVTTIRKYAFDGCSGLTSMTIPKSVTYIGNGITYGCNGLTSIKVASGNPEYDSRNNCNAIIETSSNTLVAGCKKTTIPSTVTAIGTYAFGGCKGLTSITIPSSVTTIYTLAFYNCGLKSLTIPNSVTSIGDGAFYYCYDLTSVSLPNSLTAINNYTFSDCESLISVTIPNSVIYIGKAAFYNCSSLTSITIPNSVKIIDDEAFDYCYSLTSVTIPNSVETIGNYTFAECWYLTSVNIPNSVKTIGTFAFAYCENMSSITIPNSVTSIGSAAFAGSGLTSVTIPNSVTTINDGVFAYCTDLTSVTIPNSVTTIGEVAFYSCSSLTSVTIPSSVTSIVDGAFMNCDNLTAVIAQKTSPVEIEDDVFTNRANATLYVPQGSKSAYEGAEYWNEFNSIVEYLDNHIVFADKNVKDICVNRWDTDHNGWLSYQEAKAVTSLGNAFSNKSNITSFHELQYFTGLTSIGYQNFFYCSGLQSLTIPNSVTSIDNQAFAGCGLTSVIIPSNVTTIERRAFDQCHNLSSISVASGNTVYDSRNHCNAIIKKSNNALVVGCMNTVIPNSVTSIGQEAFYHCIHLTSIYIPSGVTTIGPNAFSYCRELTSVNIPESVTSIGDGAFSNCEDLTSVTIPNGVTSIGDYTFYCCYDLTSVTIGNNVTDIGDKAIAGCGMLKDVYCYAQNIPSTEYSTFEGTSIGDATLHVPSSALEDYKNTEPWRWFKAIVPLDGVATGIMDVAAASVRVKSYGGVITVEGIDNHTPVSVYTMDGMLAGNGTVTDRTATISTSLKPGTPVIVKMGGKAMKTIVR